MVENETKSVVSFSEKTSEIATLTPDMAVNKKTAYKKPEIQQPYVRLRLLLQTMREIILIMSLLKWLRSGNEKPILVQMPMPQEIKIQAKTMDILI